MGRSGAKRSGATQREVSGSFREGVSGYVGKGVRYRTFRKSLGVGVKKDDFEKMLSQQKSTVPGTRNCYHCRGVNILPILDIIPRLTGVQFPAGEQKIVLLAIFN